MEAIKKNDLKKTGLWLVLFFIAFKSIYIIIEYFYNINIFNVVSSNDFYNEKKINELNNYGHKISAIGIAILITPSFYFIYKYIKNIYTKYISYIVTFIFIYLISYNSLDKLVDYIVKLNLNKSYEAYYINMFKIGLYHGHLKYDSFVNYDNIINKNLSIDEKLLFINSFLLLNADSNLLEKLKEKGKDNFLNIYIEQNQNDFNDKFNKYILLDNEIKDSYVKFNSKREELKNKQKNNINIDKEYKDFINSLKKSYKEYSNKIIDTNKISNKDLEKFKSELNVYINNRDNNKYKKIYNNKIISMFGEVLPPENFMDNNGNINIYKIKSVINDKSKKLSFEEFILTNRVQNKIKETLSSKGLKTNSNVDYTKEINFKNLFHNNINSKFNNINNEFKNKLNKEFGKNDLKLNMNYNDFINSKFIKNKLNPYLKEFDLNSKYINNIIKVLNSENKVGAFKSEIYINIIKESKIIEKYLFSKEDFEKNEEAKKYGELSIKLLYVPIFALILSMFSLLFNLVFLISYIVFKILKINIYIRFFVNILLISLVLLIPLINNKTNLLKNELLSLIDLDFYYYIKLLEILKFYEGIIN